MISIPCRGLPASWINGWLAAVGAVVLDRRLRLSWTEDATPAAVLSSDGDPAEVLAESWPSAKALDELPLAPGWDPGSVLERKIPLEAFVDRVRAARGSRHSWTISSTLTDLHLDQNGEVAHAPFDPAGPGTIKWLHHRLAKVHRQVEPTPDRLRDSLAGCAVRVKDNGLGFDQTRLGSQSDSTAIWVDPVVEVLAFFGLALFPLRGRGTDDRLGRSLRSAALQRGWRTVESRDGERSEVRFLWPAWSPQLDRDGIDALLDVWQPERRSAWRRLGVHAAWRIVPYRQRAQSDATRAFGSERWVPVKKKGIAGRSPAASRPAGAR